MPANFLLLLLMVLSCGLAAPMAVAADPQLNLEARLIGGDVTRFDRLMGTKGLVLLAREGGCPISERYGNTIKALENKYTARGFSFVYLYVGQFDIAASAKADLLKYKLRGSYTVDPQLIAARHFGLKTTTESLVFNKSGKLIYRGAINNQQTLSGPNPRASEHYLADALESELKKEPVKIPLTEAPGCHINTLSEATEKNAALTFNQDIYPLLEKKCVLCHRADNSLIDLSTYESVRARATMIRYVLEKNLMPPWFVKPGLGPWVNDLSISPGEKEKIFKWLATGLPEGSGKKTESVQWNSGWRGGEPDKIIKLPRAIKVQADGIMPYQHFIIKTDFKKEMWVKSYEILTEPKVVHHISFYVLKNPKDVRPAQFPLNFISSFTWGMGNPPTIFPAGVGSRIPPHATIGLTVHYQPNGIATVDRETRLGLKFHSEKPPHLREELGFADENLNIPPQGADHISKMTKYVDKDSYVTLMAIHMHVRGKSSQIDVLLPDGTRKNLLDLTRYNTYHQFLYEYQTPLFIPKGSTLECTNHFDNSKNNPLNPDPNKEVHWGEQITDEMSICSVETYAKT